MKPASERRVGWGVPLDPSLEALLARLDALSLEPTFLAQRQIALARALRPYGEYQQRLPMYPLPEEVALATLYLYADYYPEDGQLSLVEQLRDVITEHVPADVRAWLDPLHHSHMDLLEIVGIEPRKAEADLILRSLGNSREFHLPGGAWSQSLREGQALLTRLIHGADRPLFAGTALPLSASAARSVFQATEEWRREMEAQSGSFALGEWVEFAKQYGYVLLWQVAQTRLKLLIETEAGTRFRTPTGEPFLYALALYDHHEFRVLSEGLDRAEGFHAEPPGPPGQTNESVRAWVQRGGAGGEPAGAVTARVILTPAQLMVECDSQERLDAVKHLLAATFGYSLHFRGESAAVPAHPMPDGDLLADAWPSVSVEVTADEDYRLLKGFLESVYLEWADQPSPALGGRTPRHTAAEPDGRATVGALIERMERDDPARRRTGRPGYDYNMLRAHVGL